MSEISRREMLRRTVNGVAALGAGAMGGGLSLGAAPGAGGAGGAEGAGAGGRPNIVFILADDLGYGDVGCFGQKLIGTPRLDRMAAEGMRFTQAYCGTSVCAPSRCALMTGLHIGHAPIRGNREHKPEGQQPMPADTYTVAHLLKGAGYATACIGKWGLGFPGSESEPGAMGFDHFFGYNCQREAHNYYPDHLWRNREKVPLDGKTYSHDLIAEEALGWVKKQAGPFFLYLAFTIPHGNYQVPELGEYADVKWDLPAGAKDPAATLKQARAYAAMVSRMDRDIGRLLDLLKEIGQDQNTLVLFASDNGSAFANDSPISRLFNSSGGLRGFKRGMYEGGLRSPSIARWPGRVAAGAVCEEPWAFWDFLPTCAELAGAGLAPGRVTDGVSIVPALRGGKLPERDHLYWELHEAGFRQAVRRGDWKAVRNGPAGKVELYDLKADPGEKRDVAAENAEVAGRMEALLKSARMESKVFPVGAK